jgi:muconolactone D-isomerase
MQEYLVSISINLPDNMLGAELNTLTAAEHVRGKELQIKGVIKRIWRIPGTRDNIGIWMAEDSTKLHGFIELLPLFEFMTIKVTPLAIHPLEKE